MNSLNAIGNAPAIFLRSFFGFSPEEDGYIGWTQEVHRAHVMEKVKSGDLFLIYGAGAAQTPKAQRRQVLGVIQVDAQAIRDVDKASAEGMKRKARGWAGKWSYALPARRAWRSAKAIPIDYVAQETYDPKAGQAIATWSPQLTIADAARVMKLEVVEVPVFGEPPLLDPSAIKAPLFESFNPSRGLSPSFGIHTVTRVDGEHRLYVMKMEGEIAAVLDRPATTLRKKRLVKVGFSNDVKRRCNELNAGLPSGSKVHWELWLQSKPLPSGAEAKLFEDKLKASFAVHAESLGNEFFLGDETTILIRFADIHS